MTKHTPHKDKGSLLERAADLYEYAPMKRVDGKRLDDSNGQPQGQPQSGVQAQQKQARKPEPKAFVPQNPNTEGTPAPRTNAAAQQALTPTHNGPRLLVDRDQLRDSGFIVPDGPTTAIAEEFRIIKRQLLLAAKGSQVQLPLPLGERILVCSAHPDEGKTFCAMNLSLSIAAEKDNEVLLVDADFAKPSILSSFGLEGGPGLMDALADPSLPVEKCILQTDIEGLSILPAGEQTNYDTEYLASSRTDHVLNRLTQHNPNRIVIFDSPPALSASPASVLATHVGQVLMVVRADKTTETALRDSLNLLGGCDYIQLLLNGTKFSPTGRRFGSYYGYGE